MAQDLIDKLFNITDDLKVRIQGIEAVELLLKHRISQVEQSQSDSSTKMVHSETKMMELIKNISDKQDGLIRRLDVQEGQRQAFKYLPTLLNFLIAVCSLVLLIRSFK